MYFNFIEGFFCFTDENHIFVLWFLQNIIFFIIFCWLFACEVTNLGPVYAFIVFFYGFVLYIRFLKTGKFIFINNSKNFFNNNCWCVDLYGYAKNHSTQMFLSLLFGISTYGICTTFIQ